MGSMEGGRYEIVRLWRTVWTVELVAEADVMVYLVCL
jgi:hypothetical protein